VTLGQVSSPLNLVTRDLSSCLSCSVSCRCGYSIRAVVIKIQRSVSYCIIVNCQKSAGDQSKHLLAVLYVALLLLLHGCTCTETKSPRGAHPDEAWSFCLSQCWSISVRVPIVVVLQKEKFWYNISLSV
jgi:hypothetical protein